MLSSSARIDKSKRKKKKQANTKLSASQTMKQIVKSSREEKEVSDQNDYDDAGSIDIDSNNNDNDDEDVFISGFHSTDFVLWNSTRHFQVCRIPCGGGRRPYAVTLNPQNPADYKVAFASSSSYSLSLTTVSLIPYVFFERSYEDIQFFF